MIVPMAMAIVRCMPSMYDERIVELGHCSLDSGGRFTQNQKQNAAFTVPFPFTFTAEPTTTNFTTN